MNLRKKKRNTSSVISITLPLGGSKRLTYLLRPRRVLSRLLSILLLAAGLPVHALPVGGQVSAGQGTIKENENGNILTVTQDSQKLSVNWRAFNIGAGELVNFTQPSANSIALNRILGDNASLIYGQLSANGQVFLLNPNGVLFGKTAQVNAGGIVASTLNLSDADFMAGKFSFSGNAGSVVNQGAITAKDGGYVALLGGTVGNEGRIVAQLGMVALASGKRITLNFHGDQLINLQVDQGTLNALVENQQLIQADGGQVILTARGQDAVFSGVVNNTGLIQAQTISQKNGLIRLSGSAENDTVHVAGKIDASAPHGGDGGQIETSAAHVQIDQGTTITATAPGGKSGQWLLSPADINIDVGLANVIQDTLNNGTNTTVATAPVGLAGSSNGSGDITLSAPLTWNSASNLAFNAYRDIRLNGNLTGSGGGSVALRADARGTGTGTVSFGADNYINLSGGNGTPWQNSISIYYNPVNYTDAATRSDTSGNPYAATVTHGVLAAYMLVNDATRLQDMSTNLAGIYALGKNINAATTASTNWDAASASYLGFAPLGDACMSFRGTLDGLGHGITGLTVNRPLQSYVGLFGYNNGTVRNVGIEGGSITGRNHVGGLVGYNSGTISNAYATDAVSVNIGAVIAQEQSNGASNAFAAGAANGTIVNVGGLVGYNSGTINNAYANGAVTANIGSTIAYAYTPSSGGSAVSNAYAIGGVNGSSLRIGGLVGYNNGNISDAYATGAVSGIVGSTIAYAASSVGTSSTANGNGEMAGGNAVSNAYAIGAVSDSSIFIGGLTGYNDGVVRNTYATGSVNGSIGSTNAIAAGAVSGNTDGGILSGNVISTAYAAGAVSDSVIGIGGLLGFNRGNVITSYATGNVSSSIGGTHASANGDVSIDAGNGGSVYGSTLSNAYATRALSGSAVTVGGLVGYNAGNIRDAYAMSVVSGDIGTTSAQATGAVIANAEVGGIATSTTHTNAVATDAGTGMSAVGGLVGYNAADVTNAYSTGYITGISGRNAFVGGLVGLNSGNVKDSYWDTQTSGQSGSDGGTGMTTAQMMQQSSYPQYDPATGNGWDYNRVWGIVNGVSYPYFRWQYPDAPQIVSGTVDGAGGGKTVQSLMNGVLLRHASTGANGFYYIALPSNTVGNNVPLLTYVANDHALQGGHLRMSDGGHQTEMDITPASLTVSSRAGVVSNNSLVTVKGEQNAVDIPYRTIGNNAMLTDGFSFLTLDGTQFLLNGNITATGGIRFDGPLLLATDAALDAGGGNITFNAAVDGPHALTLNSGGNVHQAAPVTVAGLELLGINGNYQLTDAGNDVGVLAANTGTVNLVNRNSLTVGTVGRTSGINASGTVSLVTTDRDSDITLDQAVQSTGEGTSVVLAAGRHFINNAGAQAVTAEAGRWLIYSDAPEGNLFGSLTSGALPLWNRTYASNEPSRVTEEGNRYLFRYVPSLTVTADSKRKYYGDAVNLTASISGLVDANRYGNVFTQEQISGSPEISSAGANVGAPASGSPYAIMVGQGTLSSAPAGYGETHFVNGQLVVDKAHLTIMADDKTRLYGAPNPPLTATISGYANGENASTAGVTGAANLSTSATPTTNVGTATITASTGTLAAGNYDFSHPVDGKLTIDKAHLTVTADDKTRLYGDPNPALTATISGFKNGEDLAGSGVNGRANLVTDAGPGTVGSAQINVTQGSLAAANYDFTDFKPGTLAITVNPTRYQNLSDCGWFSDVSKRRIECHNLRAIGLSLAKASNDPMIKLIGDAIRRPEEMHVDK